MRRTQSGWQRRSRKWIKKLTVVSLLAAAAVGNLDVPLVLGAGPSKKPAKAKAPEKARPTEKVARKPDDVTTPAATKTLPKTIADSHPLKPLIAKAESSLKALNDVKDYSAVLSKKELIQSKVVSQTLNIKVRHEPFSVYLKFVAPYAGREVIYVDGQNKGRFMVHETGFKSLAGTLSFTPTSKEAMAENRHPITEIGMQNMLETLVEQWKAEGQYQEVTVKQETGVKLGEAKADLLEVTHPRTREYFKYHKTRLYLDSKTKLPIRLEQYTWPEKEGGEAVLVEEYNYTQVATDIGLTNVDFDKTNPAYQF